MLLASILLLNTLTMLTNTYADRSRPTLKDDERFRTRLVCDLNTMKAKLLATMNAKLTMNTKLTMNANVTKLLKTNMNLNSMLCASLNCSNDVNKSPKNVDEAKLQVTGINAVLLLTKETRQYINAVWKLYVKSIEVQVTLLMFVTCFIFICTVLCIITNDVQNKSDVIQELIVSSVFF